MKLPFLQKNLYIKRARSISWWINRMIKAQSCRMLSMGWGWNLYSAFSYFKTGFPTVYEKKVSLRSVISNENCGDGIIDYTYKKEICYSSEVISAIVRILLIINTNPCWKICWCDCFIWRQQFLMHLIMWNRCRVKLLTDPSQNYGKTRHR